MVRCLGSETMEALSDWSHFASRAIMRPRSWYAEALPAVNELETRNVRQGWSDVVWPGRCGSSLGVPPIAYSS